MTVTKEAEARMPENNNNVSLRRIGYLDFLKFIGLTGIIIAHVGSPEWLLMLRNFDVPLMVLLSALLGFYSFKKYDGMKYGTIHYYWNRVKRLIFPTWFFLLFYFSLMFLATKDHRSLEYYIASFCLTRYGIGYVWIILIYLYSAMLIPLYSKIGFSVKTTLFIVALYFVYEIAYYYRIGTDNRLIDTTFYYIVPYGGVLTYLGFNYNRIKRKKAIAIFSLFIFIGLMIYYWIKLGSFQSVQIAKYPPRFYYLSFGIAVSFFLLLFCERHDFDIYYNPIVVYISKHSMWIYLWHILILSVYRFAKLPKMWYVQLIVVYTCSMIIVFLVNKALDLIEARRKISILKYLRG